LSLLYREWYIYGSGFIVNLVYDYLFAYIGYSVVKFEAGQNHFWFDFAEGMSTHNVQVMITWIVFL
jgi:hypothetical protein